MIGGRWTDGATALATREPGWDPRWAPDVRAVALGFSKDPNPKTTLLLFWPNSSTPWAALKLPATAAARDCVAREAAFLTEIHRRFDHAALSTVPRVLPTFECGLPEGSLVVQALGGVPLATLYRGAGHVRRPFAVQADLTMVSVWLQEIQGATRSSHGTIELCDAVAAAVVARFPDDVRAARALRVLEPVAREFSRFRGPKTVVHGDLWLANILTESGTVTGVIDWESAELVGEPLRDVARFALTYALYLDRQTRPGRRVRGHGFRAGPWGAGIEYVLTADSWFPRLVQAFVCGAMARLGADPVWWRELMLVGLADVAATADDPDWAYAHLTLLDRLSGERPAGEPR